MSSLPEPEKSSNILSKFVSVIGLLGAGLFFTGWIYRWAYFSTFQLDLSALNLPTQSFLVVPIQVFLGNPVAILKTALVIILSAVVIYLTLRLVDWLVRKLSSVTLLRRLAPMNATEAAGINLLRSLLNEAIIIAWIFVFLFWSARGQGFEDAQRDSRNTISTLPVVALVAPLGDAALGRQLKDVFQTVSVDKFSIIGDKGLFDDLKGKEDTDITNSERPRVWRLLLNYGGWIYVFSALPSNAPRDARPLVLAMKESDKRMMILSPTVSKQ